MQLNEFTTVAVRKGPPRAQDAIAPIPATANAYDMTTEDEIGDTLTLLAESGEAISMYGTGSRDVVLGRILSVDPELPHFVMELNEGATLPPGKVTFVAWLRSAKLQFRLEKSEWKSVSGKPTLIPMVFPETCAVLNRRTTERLETPLGANYLASFVVNGIPYEIPVYDYSLGGIGLRCSKYLSKGLIRGRKLVDVRLDFGPETVISAELEIRSTRSCRSFLLGEQIHLGCKFVNLQPEAESKIKALMDQVASAALARAACNLR
ncbi:flagellar brake protein [Pseudoduganella sp. OTU4001]|uniref:flagellar brake protein n=1 Tax=Pseudoduganella sp. OTU4001 TaxID=3043854 RepID=UPI00313C628F